MTVPKRILILGTGSIAHTHAKRFKAIPDCELVAAVDVNAERAEAFAAAHGIGNSFGDLDAALRWGAFDAAVNSTPDAAHYPTTMRLIAAGAHVFCEKPLAVNHADAMAMTEAAERAGIIAMVNLTYRNAHAIQMARRMVDEGLIGEIRHVDASYLQSWLTAAHWGDWHTDERWLWRLSAAHGSKGVVGDIGVHILDFLSFGTGLDVASMSARLKTYPKAEGDAIGAYRLDVNDSCVMTVELANGALGVVHMSRYGTGRKNDLDLTIHGTKGALKVWSDHETSNLEACLGDDIQTQGWRPVECPPTPNNNERFVRSLFTGEHEQPNFRHAAGIQKLLDLCFVSDEERRELPVG